MTFQLTITPLKPTEIPQEDQILEEARKILTSTSSWKQGKTYGKYKVVTSSRAKVEGDGAPWHCRSSTHAKEDGTFDEMWDKLANDKAHNEMQYIPEIQKTTHIQKISESARIETLYYKFPPPISPRVFTVLQLEHLSTSTPRTGIIVSIPIDLSSDADLLKLEEKGVKGRYVAVEQLVELEDGRVEWTMATSSTPGGRIPSFVTEASLPGQIASDVSRFFDWLKTTRPAPKADGAAAT